METLGLAYAYTRMHTHAPDPHKQASCMRTRTWACVRMLGFQKLRKTSFSALKPRFGMNLTSSKSRSKPLFSQYKKPYMVSFQNTENINEKPLFTRNSESKREFFHKISSIQFSFD